MDGVIRLDVVQYALIVGHDKARLSSRNALTPSATIFNASISSRVRLIQDAQFRLQHRHLQSIIALFSPPGKTDVLPSRSANLRHFSAMRSFLPSNPENQNPSTTSAAVGVAAFSAVCGKTGTTPGFLPGTGRHKKSLHPYVPPATVQAVFHL